jgi:small-conductance mechanosensitive channel
MEFFNELLQSKLFEFAGYQVTVLNIALLGAIVLAIWLLRWAINQAMAEIYENFKVSTKNKEIVSRFFTYVIAGFAILMGFRSLGIPLDELMNYKLFSFNEKHDFTLGNIIYVFLIFLFVRILLWTLRQILDSYFEKDKVDVGAQYAILQVIKYVVFTSAIIASIEALGFDLSIIWGGAAALMVGFGLGLQHTFNDLVSGLLLLIERTVEVGDTLDIDGTIGIVQRIGLRVSHIKSRDNIMILVPNSKLVTSKVINWSHKDDITKFTVKIGVAYGTDTAKVKRLLLEVANKHEEIETYPSPFVRFVDFADSSLDFELHFWCKDLMRVEDIKSDLRFTLDEIFRKEKIEIPFPQREVWTK